MAHQEVKIILMMLLKELAIITPLVLLEEIITIILMAHQGCNKDNNLYSPSSGNNDNNPYGPPSGNKDYNPYGPPPGNNFNIFIRK